jgi:hypothetical protein
MSRFVVIIGAVPFCAILLFAHGATGRATPADQADLRVGLTFAPRNFTLGAFKWRCTPSGQPPSDEDLFRTVTKGLPGTPMEAHRKDLTEQERRAVVLFVKTLSPKANNSTG